MKMKTEEMYAKMNPWRLFFVIALPGMISMFAMSIYSIVEGIFIGHTLGEGAFAAVNIALPLVMINYSLADLIGVGASVPISIALGRKDHEEANNVFTCSVIMIFCASAFMGTVMFTAAEPLARMMGADDVLLETSVRYLRTCALCSPLAAIFFAMDNYLRISGYIKLSMFINVGQNLATIGLLAFFLLVCDMDVVGAALATSISICVCSAIALIPFVTKRALLKFTKPRFHLDMFKKIVSCGSPVFLSNISGRVTSIIMNIALMTMGDKVLGENGGTTAVAAYAVLMYASDFCWPLLYGIADSLSPAIGYNWGAKDYKRVKKIAKCSYIGTATVGIITTAILFLCPRLVASLFVNANDDPMLMELAAQGIKIFCFTYLFRWFVVSTQSFFSAIEKPLQATLVSVSSAFIFPIILLGALWSFGLDGIWFNFVGVTIITAAVSGILMLLFSRELKKREDGTHAEITLK